MLAMPHVGRGLALARKRCCKPGFCKGAHHLAAAGTERLFPRAAALPSGWPVTTEEREVPFSMAMYKSRLGDIKPYESTEGMYDSVLPLVPSTPYTRDRSHLVLAFSNGYLPPHLHFHSAPW